VMDKPEELTVVIAEPVPLKAKTKPVKKEVVYVEVLPKS